jgi:branched-chain amino acid transport system substrate-binding protein
MLAVEAVRRAQERYGKGKVMTGEQVRWGYGEPGPRPEEAGRPGFAGVMRPISTSCADHMGSNWARVHTWDGKKWDFSPTGYQADEQILKPMVKATAAKYAGRQETDATHTG